MTAIWSEIKQAIASDLTEKNKLLSKLIRCNRNMPDTILMFYPVGPIPYFVHWPSVYKIHINKGLMQVPGEFFDSHLQSSKGRNCHRIVEHLDNRWIDWHPVDLSEYDGFDIKEICPWCQNGYVRQMRFASLVGVVDSQGRLDPEVKIIDIPSSLYNSIADLMESIRKTEGISCDVFTSLGEDSPWKETGIPCFMINSNNERGASLRYNAYLSRKSVKFEDVVGAFDACEITWGDLAVFIDPSIPKCDPPPMETFDPDDDPYDDDPFMDPFDIV